MLGGSISSAVVASLHERNQISLAIIFVILSGLTLLSLKLLALKDEVGKIDVTYESPE